MFKKKKNNNKGFTMIELAVVVAIIAILTLVIIFNYRDFSGNVEIKNIAYEVALSIREMQVYGISSVNIEDSGFDSPYGVSFYVSNDPVNSFDTFVDINESRTFQNSELIETLVMNQDVYLIDIKAGTSCVNENRVDITFKRPDPEAIIRATGSTYSFVELEFSYLNDRSKVQYLIIRSPGQIYVSDESEC